MVEPPLVILEIEVITCIVIANNKETTNKVFHKTSIHINRKVYKAWLCRYLQSMYVVFDNSNKIKLYFASLWDQFNIECKSIIVKTPQTNAISEWLHSVLGNMLCATGLKGKEDLLLLNIVQLIMDAAGAVCSTNHTLYALLKGLLYMDMTWCSITHTL